jgi:predicted nucleic acid-binding protein
MAVLVDTSVLGRLANRADISYQMAKSAVAELHRRGEVLHVTAQNLIEFLNFATRPVYVNGLGLAPSAAHSLQTTFEATFPLLEKTPDIYPAWKGIVQALGVIGKQVHDARLVAVCHVHAISHLLTFNSSHFTRMTGFGPGVVVLNPIVISSASVPTDEP